MSQADTNSVTFEWQNSLVTTPAANLPDLGSLLCLADHETPGTDAAILRIAAELAAPAARPVLLLDLGQPANRFWNRLSRSGRLEPRPSPAPAAPNSAVLQFYRLRAANLMVSFVTPDPAYFGDDAWQLRKTGALARLHELFSRIVLVPPAIAQSGQAWWLAGAADATLLLLRKGKTEAAAAQRLRDQVIDAGGWPVGSVLVS